MCSYTRGINLYIIISINVIMTENKKYLGLKIQIFGIAIVLIGLFLASYTEFYSYPVGYYVASGNSIFETDTPFMQLGFVVTAIGTIIVLYGLLRKD